MLCWNEFALITDENQTNHYLTSVVVECWMSTRWQIEHLHLTFGEKLGEICKFLDMFLVVGWLSGFKEMRPSSEPCVKFTVLLLLSKILNFKLFSGFKNQTFMYSSFRSLSKELDSYLQIQNLMLWIQNHCRFLHKTY